MTSILREAEPVIEPALLYGIRRSHQKVRLALRELEGFDSYEYIRNFSEQVGETKLKYSDISDWVTLTEFPFETLLVATNQLFEAASRRNIPRDIKVYMKLRSVNLLKEKTIHLRNVRLHPHKNQPYFWSSTETPIPADDRDYRSARWLKAKYPRSYPFLTNRRGNDYLIGGILSVKSIARVSTKYQLMLDSYSSII